MVDDPPPSLGPTRLYSWRYLWLSDCEIVSVTRRPPPAVGRGDGDAAGGGHGAGARPAAAPAEPLPEDAALAVVEELRARRAGWAWGEVDAFHRFCVEARSRADLAARSGSVYGCCAIFAGSHVRDR